MIDYGLVTSLILAFGIPSLLGSWWTISSNDGTIGFLDVATGPALVDLAVGRLTTLALDDPASIGSLSDMVIIRSGVEFWPGVAAGAAAAMWSAHRSADSPSTRLAELAPLAMISYASYEAACIFRDGCFGPDSPIGLRPPGLLATVLPVGWLMAAAVAVAAIGVHTLNKRGTSTAIVVLTAVFAVASTRAVGSVWLPHVGDGPTRQHLASIAIAGVTIVSIVALSLRPHSSTTSQN